MGHPTLTVLDHPFVRSAVALMRDESTGTAAFRSLVDYVTPWLGYEALRSMPEEAFDVQTPLETTEGHRVSRGVVLVPILRAGLGMVEGLLKVVHNARVGHLGMYRDAESHNPVPYYERLPSGLETATTLVLDPMLATGGSASEAIRRIRAAGGVDIRMLALISAPEGVELLARDHPDVPVFTAALDRELDDNAYIRPGLGDAGDRLYGTDH